jgi:uncharacterized membrane protein YtjA (UPF0391 family)
MLLLALLFLILCAAFGIIGFATTLVWVGFKVLFWIFLALLIISLIGHLTRPRATA